uniref:Uncharacterized protein n=1 Tax=Ceratitis capitata TaxID=7213 RepID=W8CA41_CERCA
MKLPLEAYILILTFNCVYLAKCKRESRIADYYNTEEVFNDYDDSIYPEDEEDFDHIDLPEDCKILQYYVLRRKCNDLYPEDVAENYRDPFVSAHDQYAVFHFTDDGVENYFLTFHHSALFHCDEIEVRGVVNFVCTNASGTQHHIKMRSGYMQCLSYKSDMVDELLAACSSDMNKSSNFTALHYANVLSSLRSDCNVHAMIHRWLLLGLAALVISFEY